MATTRPNKLVQAFVEKYRDVYRLEYRVEHNMVTMAKQIQPYYSEAELDMALNFYFSRGNDHSFYQFISNIAKYFHEAEIEKEGSERLEKVLKDTKDKLKELLSKPIGGE